MSDKFVKFEDWEKTVPDFIKKDSLWESLYYRVALYLYDLVWDDCEILQKDFRAKNNVGQVVRSSGGISANMEEAAGRGIGTPDYVRILKISLDEIRETRGWYYRSRHALPSELLEHRFKVIDRLKALVVNTLNSHKGNLGKKK
ncbi:MAG: four helix bundle protein [Anaerolineaceae bacterium]|nr:MAG: four helix bundle protein [Anaerolineaceae bacterium]